MTAQQNEMLFWLAGMNYVKIRTHCRAQNLMTQHGETWNCVFEAELKMDTRMLAVEFLTLLTISISLFLIQLPSMVLFV